jgi:hypothetical protein
MTSKCHQPAPDWHREVYNRIRKQVMPVRPSQYDITNDCNLRCEGCLFFAGSDYLGHPEEIDPSRIDVFFAGEAERGVNFAQFGGAEPALALDTLRIAARHIRRGVVFTNGTVRIPEEIPYRLHISLWGLPESSAEVRGADVVEKALRNYRGDRRAVFVFTVNARNIETLPDVVEMCAEHGVRLTFSHFSPTTDYWTFLRGRSGGREFFRMRDGNALTLDTDQLGRAEALIARAMEEEPDTVVYTPAFNRWIHRPGSLFSIDPATGVALDCGSRVTKRYRHYHADLTDAGQVKCCAPNLDCSSCRIYAQSLSSALRRGRDVYSDDAAFAEWVEMWNLWCRLFLVGWEETQRPGRADLIKVCRSDSAVEREVQPI